MEASVKLREEGNRVLEQANDIWIAASVRGPRYEKAIGLYERSSALAKTADEFCSANKNLIIARFRWIRLTIEEPGSSTPVASPYDYLQRTLSLFVSVIERSFEAKDKAWRENFAKSVDEHLRVVVFEWDIINKLPNKDKLPIYEKIIQGLGIPGGRSAKLLTAALVHAKIGRIYFLQAVSESDKTRTNGYSKEKVRVLQKLLSDAQFAVGKADSFAPHGDVEVSEELYDLRSDVEQMQHRVSAYGDYSSAEELLLRSWSQSEHLLMELVWEAIDFFRSAIMRTKEFDIELEAICIARIGYIYVKILKNEKKGHEFNIRAIQLAETLKPRNFHGDSWYIGAQEMIQEHRKKIISDEVDKGQKVPGAKNPLQPILDVINETRDDFSFIKFLYEKHPPRGKSTHALPKVIDSSNVKNIYKQAILDYHPDKQTDKSADWAVISNEIIKQLNTRYERYKL